MIINKLSLPLLVLIGQSAFAQVGQGLNMKGEMMSFPVKEVVIPDEFFGDTTAMALTSNAIEVRSNHSTMINSALTKFGEFVLAKEGTRFENPVAISAYTNGLKTIELLENKLDFKFDHQVKLVVDRYLDAPWTADAPNLSYSEAGYIRDMGIVAFSPASPDMKSLAISLDIVAHEIAHVVIGQTSKLDTTVGSQAINEAFGDIIGIYAESLNAPKNWNWKIGEEVYLDGVSFHRDIADPNDPRVLRHRDHFTAERAHALSGIITTSFYYLVTGKDLAGNEVMKPTSMDTAVKLYFDTITNDLESNTNFTKLKDALVLRSPTLANKIMKAFEMVGM